MTVSVLTDWDEQKAKAFGKENIIAQHNLHERPMFTDEGLIDLLDNFPRHDLGIYTMSHDPLERESFKAGDAKELSGKELFDAVHAGRLWFNLRRANEHLPEFAALADDMFGDMEAKTPGLKTNRHDLGVLISSPNAQVFYHFDIPLVTLWQIRGTKRVWLYPPEPPYLDDDDLENVVLKETEEEIDFDLAYDKGAMIVDLKPGMMATWPQNGPHRIVNQDMVNVSLSCEFQTHMSLVRANAIYANGVFRRNFGMDTTILNNGPISLHAKAAFGKLFKILKLRKSFEYQIPRTFDVDPVAVNGLRKRSEAG